MTVRRLHLCGPGLSGLTTAQGGTTMLRAIYIAAFALAVSCVPALAEMNGSIRFGVLNDMSGVYSDFQVPG